MEILNNLLLGFQVAFSLENLLFCFLGVLLGTLVGVLPGIGTLAAISILLPFTYGFDSPISSIIFLAGIYYGTQYGGSTTSILLNLPGEPASVVTTLDGYKMSLKGRAGAALSIAAIGSFFAGTVATLLIALSAAPLSKIAFLFGPAEYASLMVLGLIAAVALTNGSFLKGLGMVVIGILLSTVGQDINSGVARFTFDIPNLYDGISFGIIAMAIFGLAEILYNAIHQKMLSFQVPTIKNLYPTKKEFKRSVPAIGRGSLLGSIMGVIPGAGAVISSFISYSIEKKISKNPEKFGEGAIEGVAAPESANNAAAQTSFIPMLSLGIPTTPVMAVMVAALMIHSIQPGPQILQSNPALFWGVIASMWIGNFFLLILNLPLVGIWVRILKIPRMILFPLVVLVCIYGAYSLTNDWFFVWMLIPFTILGYIFKILNCEPAPLALGFVIGTLFEEYLRRSLMISRGDWITFVDKPISLSFLILAVAVIFLPMLIRMLKK
jgi:putative tricarboxylic transport membrane protein